MPGTPKSSALRRAVAPDDSWIPIAPDEPPTGYLSVYYSDPLARYPVRHITRVKDNKSDPNIETGTYGLFSTCEARMRTSFVDGHRRYLFFITSHRSAGRALTGYYDVGWHRDGALTGRAKDYELLARSLRFVDPLPLDDIAGALGEWLRRWFRGYKKVDPELTAEILALLDARADRTGAYLDEVERIEQLALRHTSYRYPSWRRTVPFTWDGTNQYVPGEDHEVLDVRNSSPTGQWTCVRCNANIISVARLKSCPECGRLGTLQPVPKT